MKVQRALLLALGLSLAPSMLAAETASLVLTGGRVWTGDAAHPWAEGVAVKDDRVVGVGSAAELAALRGSGTRSIDLAGRFVAPGFIDTHTHFDRAGELIVGVNLLDVADEVAFARRVREARDRLPAGSWLVGGDWGAYALDSPFKPHRSMIDAETPSNPALLSKWDRSLYLANGAALKAAGATCDWPGVECEGGTPTGRLTPEAAQRVRAVIPPKPLEQRLAEARAALAQLRGFGVTTIHDVTPAEELAVYQELRRRGELTVRIYARPGLDQWEHLAALGVRRGFGDDWIKIGGLKGYVDGIMGNSSARFYEPYLTSGERGSWRPMMEPAGNMEKLLRGADSIGFWPQVHAIGDEAIDTILDLFEKVMAAGGPKERRFRAIHVQVMRGPEVAQRMARLGVIAEVQPYHAIDDLRWMEKRIGPARSRWAYAFKTLQDAGVRLSFGSDWPGTNASWYPASPVLGIYAAVTRQTLDGQPAGGWHPEERVDLETALRAYTVNAAWAAGEEDRKGTLAPGKLADLVVLDRDPFAVPPSQLKDLRVMMTLAGGRVVYEAGKE